jgi:molecular chaperone GrpE (heat shock protein)
MWCTVTLIDVRAKTNPERTPEFLEGAAKAMLATLEAQGVLDARVRIELFDPERGYASVQN